MYRHYVAIDAQQFSEMKKSVPTPRMFDTVPLVWICNPDPLSIRIFNPQKHSPTRRMFHAVPLV